METLLYVVWFLIPTIFFVLALWSKLEYMSGQSKRASAADLFRQGVFVLGCVIVCVLIDQFLLKDLVENLAPSAVPLGFFQGFLLPVILLIAAKIVGPSKSILITDRSSSRQAPRPPRRRS